MTDSTYTGPILTQRFYRCGGCDHLHPYGWIGDCRDNAQRYTDAHDKARRAALTEFRQG